ncbi:MAG TPA: hypothetical protein VGZ22_00860 [Isosphaeraceae bacterium]|jgi:hypothetical protein|nr:hypothetical protein [Isosphaeraceae bacterium]
MSTRRSFIVVAGVIVISACGVHVSWAQRGYNAVSLEALVAESEVVVRASVADISITPTDDDQRVWLTITLKVHETLKGPAAKSLTFAHPTLNFDRTFEQWRDAGTELLWFLEHNKEYGEKGENQAKKISARYPLHAYSSGWPLIRLGPPVPAEKTFVPMPPPILTMDLKALHGPEEILAASRAAVISGGNRERVETHEIWLPHTIMQRSGTNGDINYLRVPVDGRLESLARKLIKTPVDFYSPLDAPPPRDAKEQRLREAWVQAESNQLRAEGITALRFFKSEENAALVKPFLKDPTWWIRTGPGDKERVREYYLRKAAYKVLQGWGTKVDEPVLSEPLPKNEETTDPMLPPLGR